jgi:hypothetical protein
MKRQLPPYRFFKNLSEEQIMVEINGVSAKFDRIRLHNITFAILPIKGDLILKIEVFQAQNTIPFAFELSKLFANPFIKDTLFFKSEENDFVDILLPRGYKKVKYTILNAAKEMQFEFYLNCMYLEHKTSDSERYSLADFELLRKESTIMELCHLCIESENDIEIFSRAYSDLVKEIELITNKRMFFVDLADELIQYKKLIS